MKPEEQIPVRSIYKRIKKGGYDPVTMHLRLQGRLEMVEGSLRLRTTRSDQVFILSGEKSKDLIEGSNADVQVQFDARKIFEWDDKKIIEVVVNNVFEEEKSND